MRYYNIQVGGTGMSDVPTVSPFSNSGTATGFGWTSHPNGPDKPPDPGAQEVMIYIDCASYTPDADHTPMPSEDSTIEVKGVSWDQIKMTNQLNGQHILVQGGMGVGLPLATQQSQHKGILCTGRINRAWGNWIGTEMSIGMQITVDGTDQAKADIGAAAANTGPPSNGNTPAAQTSARLTRTGPRSIDRIRLPRGNVPGVKATASVGGVDFGNLAGLLSGAGSVDIGGGMISSFISGGYPGLERPLNFIHNMMPNMPMSQAIQETLSKAFPNLNTDIKISPQLMLGYQDAGMFQNIRQWADQIYKLSRSIMNDPKYFGVHVVSHAGTIYVKDRTVPEAANAITALTLIGQPTWVEPFVIEAKCVMRGDIKPLDTVTIPAGTLMNISQGAVLPNGASPQVTNVTMEGMTGLVIKVLHVGDFRNPDGAYWSTTYRIFVDQSTPAPTTTRDPTAVSIKIRDTPAPTAPAPNRLTQRAVRRYG